MSPAHDMPRVVFSQDARDRSSVPSLDRVLGLPPELSGDTPGDRGHTVTREPILSGMSGIKYPCLSTLQVKSGLGT